MEDNNTPSGMIKLDATNYSLWKLMVVYCKDFYEPIMRDKVPTGVTEEEWRVLNRKTVGMIRLHINHNIFHLVANNKVAFELW